MQLRKMCALHKWQRREKANMTEAAMLRDRHTGQAVNQEDLTDIVNTICQPEES